MTQPYLERLAARSAAAGTVLCLGLDPDPGSLPDGFSRDVAGLERFCAAVLEAAVPSVALGTSGVSPLDLASAFATLATGGIRHDPFWVRRVEDSSGRVLEERIIGTRRVLDATTTFQRVDMLRAVVDEGTGAVVRQQGFQLPAAGKTGTTDEFNDAWFTGFTPTLSASVWVGFDRGTGLRDRQGLQDTVTVRRPVRGFSL